MVFYMCDDENIINLVISKNVDRNKKYENKGNNNMW